MKERKDGYYWIRLNPAFHGQWVIARYNKSIYTPEYRNEFVDKYPKDKNMYEWFIGDWYYKDSHVIEIDEEQIIKK